MHTWLDPGGRYRNHYTISLLPRHTSSTAESIYMFNTDYLTCIQDSCKLFQLQPLYFGVLEIWNSTELFSILHALFGNSRWRLKKRKYIITRHEGCTINVHENFLCELFSIFCNECKYWKFILHWAQYDLSWISDSGLHCSTDAVNNKVVYPEKVKMNCSVQYNSVKYNSSSGWTPSVQWSPTGFTLSGTSGNTAYSTLTYNTSASTPIPSYSCSVVYKDYSVFVDIPSCSTNPVTVLCEYE